MPAGISTARSGTPRPAGIDRGSLFLIEGLGGFSRANGAGGGCGGDAFAVAVAVPQVLGDRLDRPAMPAATDSTGERVVDLQQRLTVGTVDLDH